MQALQTLTGVSGVEVDLQSGHVRVSGEFLQSSDPLVSACFGLDCRRLPCKTGHVFFIYLATPKNWLRHWPQWPRRRLLWITVWR
ncbi:hypothetical protein LP416_03980 [Polaromonas sp. P2-4]|nr:hypothetical protein LP416_03980 [Polaromonas sp. P2-4]